MDIIDIFQEALDELEEGFFSFVYKYTYIDKHIQSDMFKIWKINYPELFIV